MKRVIFARAISLNCLAEDSFPALSDISITVLLLESKMQLYQFITIHFEGPMLAAQFLTMVIVLQVDSVPTNLYNMWKKMDSIVAN